MTTNHPAHGPLSLDRLHQIREILSKAAAKSDGGNLGYAMADMLKVIDEVLASRNAEPVLPDEKPMPEASKMHAIDAVAAIAEARGWNACRAFMLQAGNSPASPDCWIPVSERMPEEGGRYWCYVEEQNSLGKSHYQWNCSWNGEVWSDKALSGRVTHWMPLPAAPQQEVK